MLLAAATMGAVRSASLETARTIVETGFVLGVALGLVALKSTRLWAYGIVELGVAVALCVYAPDQAGTETTSVPLVTVVLAIYLAVRGVEHIWLALTQSAATVVEPPHLVSSRAPGESRVA